MSKASKAERKAQKAARKNATTINDQYDESSRVLSDEEAHRNVSYELPSFGTQVRQCFKVQMKRARTFSGSCTCLCPQNVTIISSL